MPAIDPIRIQEPVADNDRIRELKARATAALDDALDVVADNLGREEARKADLSVAGLDGSLDVEDAPAHQLDMARVMELIADPFEDG